MALRAPHLLQRKCVDFDWVCTKEEFDSWMEKNSAKVNPTKVYELPEFHKWIVEGSTNLEFEIITPGTSSELLVDLVKNDPQTIETPFGLVPSLDILFAIKDSHKYKKFNYQMNGFWKTAMDWHAMKQAGAKVREEYAAFHKLRKEEAYAGQKHPKLNVSKENFFKDDGLQDTYIFDHDDIHRSICLDGIPAYEKYLADGEEVKCSKEKFFALPESVRLAGVCQEACVLALERSLIVHKGVWTPDYAWHFALAKVSTSITSGWFRSYSYDNIFNVIKMYKKEYFNYYDMFNKALSEGRVRPFMRSKY